MKSHKQAFTLIEILVVVLIIGILAAVAIPQYQVAVMKSRYATLKHLTKSIADAQEIYYLANGDYADSLEKLDINFPTGKDGTQNTDTKYVYDWGYCRLNAGLQIACKNTDIQMEYQIYTQHPKGYESSAGKRICVAAGTHDLSAPQNKICKTETDCPTPGLYTNSNGPYSAWRYMK